jgi:hypothetical protein
MTASSRGVDFDDVKDLSVIVLTASMELDA